MKKMILLCTVYLLLDFTSVAQQGMYAIRFNGTDNYIATEYAVTLNSFTVECWVKGDAAPQQISGKKVNLINKEGNYKFIWDHESADSLGSVSLNIGGINYSASFGSLSAGIWYHLAATYDGENLRAYKNGVLISTNTVPSGNPTATTGTLSIGADGSPTTDDFFAGKMDEVRIWSSVRTADQIKAEMYREVDHNTSGLVHYFKMSNGSGTTVTNARGSYHGTLNGTSASSWIASGCFAGPGNALDFDGFDDYVALSNSNVNITGSNITVEAWINMSAFNGTGAYLSKIISTSGSSAPYGGYIFRVNNSGQLQFYFNNSGSWYGVLSQENAITLSRWYHVAAVYNGTELKLYVNGVLAGQQAQTRALESSTGSNLYIGKSSYDAARHFAGKIDEIRIWNTPRTAADIRENMFRTLDGNEEYLQGYFRMDYADGSTLFDLTANNTTGTLTNMDPATDWVPSSAFNTWIGSDNTTWNVAANWSRSAVPAATDNVGLYKWTTLGNQCNLSGTPTVDNILFSADAEPTISSGLNTTGNLLLNRNLDINTQSFYLHTNAQLVEGDYRLSATSGSIYTTRSLNNISAQNVAGLGAVLTTSANMGSTTITRSHQQVTQGLDKSILRVYRIEPQTNTGLDATLVFKYHPDELNTLTESNLKLFKSNVLGTVWTKQNSTSMNTTDHTATLMGIDGFSYWTLADQSDPLPVELSAFSASLSGANVKLKWRTETEVANFGFYVERTITNKAEWNTLGFVPGNGNSNAPKSYTYTDNTVTPGAYQYRLKQIDTDGSFTYSGVVDVIIGTPTDFGLSQNYPNPFNPSATITFDVPLKSDVTLTVFNTLGETVQTLAAGTYEAGRHTVSFTATNLPSGVYFYRLQAGEFVQIRKMVLMR